MVAVISFRTALGYTVWASQMLKEGMLAAPLS